jgi:cytochrome o ubiquinol oxidase operon protein cyoD
VLSIGFTVAAYMLVQEHIGAGKSPLAQPYVLAAIMALAVAQLAVQLIFFLHLGEEKRPRWRLISVVCAVTVVLIVVGGSIWIMANLNYNMMRSPQAVDKYLQSQDGL